MKEIVITLGVILALALPAQAQQGLPCGPRAAIIKTLAKKYKETLKFIAIAGEKNLVEIFVSKAGTWTVLFTTPDGLTCISAAGDSWEELPPVTIIEGPDT